MEGSAVRADLWNDDEKKEKMEDTKKRLRGGREERRRIDEPENSWIMIERKETIIKGDGGKKIKIKICHGDILCTIQTKMHFVS
jgi:UDP-2,3-diacylglucosamine pyrophosphatase LpxH